MEKVLFTSESVSEGHPDKVCDQISDAILDSCMKQDKHSRVACETLVKNEHVVIAGEITTNAKVNYEEVVRQVIRDIGYTDPKLGFDDKNCDILSYISQQSQDISQGVDAEEQGAGDQGIMFGFACDQTEDLMPLPIALSHKITYAMAQERKAGKADFLKPDSKSQVTVEYEDNVPKSVTDIVISTQHAEEATIEELKSYLIENIVKKVIPENLLRKDTQYFINPTGRFVIGGPVGDCGVTGRKIIVDSYGGYGRHGGGAFSGKDPSKVDRSAAYTARYIAKNLVAAGVANACEVQLAYAIGVPEPISIMLKTFGTAKFSDDQITSAIREIFPLRPKQIIDHLQLLNPIYRETSNYGHFGRKPTAEGHFTWEKTDMVDALRATLKM